MYGMYMYVCNGVRMYVIIYMSRCDNICTYTCTYIAGVGHSLGKALGNERDPLVQYTSWDIGTNIHMHVHSWYMCSLERLPRHSWYMS